MIKTNKELVAACLNVVNNHKTLYVMGCFGAPMTDSNKTRYTRNHSFNASPERMEKILAASADTFGFDCVCFIKALFWGWSGDVNHPNGGAEYKSNGVPDIGTEQMLAICADVSEDFSNIMPGELVWQPGHVGIYIGEGKAVESTEYEADGVQIQAVLPMGFIDGMPCTGWKKHGKLPYISYEEEVEENIADDGKRYRVTVEGLTEHFANNLAKMCKDANYVVKVEEIGAEQPTEDKPYIPGIGDTVVLEAKITAIIPSTNA